MSERKQIRFKDSFLNLPIKQELWLLKKTQRWLSKKSKIDEATLSKIIKGRIVPTEDEKARISKVLKKKEDYLFA